MNLNRNWKLRIREKVHKVLNKFPEKDRNRLVKVIETLLLNPYIGDIEKMEGEKNTWRRRVGAYRIFYEISSSGKGNLCISGRTSYLKNILMKWDNN